MTDYDIADTLAPKSDQLDAVDLAASGPQVFTITKVVVKKSDQQPVSISLAEFPRVWRPNKNTRRVIAAAWGKKSSEYAGRKVRLFFDADVHFGGIQTGGVRISHMSHLPNGEPVSTPVIVSKGRSEMYTVEPLTEPTRPAEPTAAEVVACTDLDTLRAMHKASGPEMQAVILERVADLKAGVE